MKKKVVLAYSGGLDTSFCCIYLTQDLGYEVHSVIVNTGGFTDDELKKIAKAKFITLPDSVSADEKKLAADLSAKSGADFDKAYVDAMVKDHKEDIAAFEEAGKKVTYPELQAFIAKTLPVLHKHLDAIQKVQSKMK